MSSPASTQPAAPWYWAGLSSPAQRVLLVAIVAVAAFFRLLYPGASYFNMFAERDWYRTYQWFTGEAFNLVGSELTQSGRLPGPALYWMQLIPMAFSYHPISLAVFVGVLGTIAVYGTTILASLAFGATAGLIAGAMYAVFPMGVLGLRYLWNPTVIFVWIVLVHLGVWKLLTEPTPRARWLALAIASAAIVSHCHASGLFLFPYLVIMLAIFRPRLPLKGWLIGATTLLICYTPFMIHEATHGFRNTSFLVKKQEKWEQMGRRFEAPKHKRWAINTSVRHSWEMNTSPRLRNEFPWFGAFTFYALFLDSLQPGETKFARNRHHSEASRSMLQALATGVDRLAYIQWIAYLAATAWMLSDVLRGRRDASRLGERVLQTSILVITAITIGGQGAFVAVVDANGVPLCSVHYTFLLYPMQFLTFAWAATRLLERHRAANGSPLVPTFAMTAFVVWLAMQACLLLGFLAWSHRTGYFVQFHFTPVKTLEAHTQIAEALRDEFQFSVPDYAERVYDIGHHYNYGWGTESGLHFLMMWATGDYTAITPDEAEAARARAKNTSTVWLVDALHDPTNPPGNDTDPPHAWTQGSLRAIERVGAWQPQYQGIFSEARRSGYIDEAQGQRRETVEIVIPKEAFNAPKKPGE